MKKTIEIDWPILPGSISTAKSRCGKDRCACKLRSSPRLHGIYYRWTGFIRGKRTTKTVTKEDAQECIKRINNLRKLQRDIGTLLRESLDRAPWTFRDKPTRTKSTR